MLGPAWQVWTSCFFGTWFWWISVNCSLAPVTASARITQTGSNVARWFYLLRCARDARVCWNRTNIFWFMVCQKWRPKPSFPLIIIEIPSRDSLLARTDINTQDRQESTVGVVSAVSACYCVGQHRLPVQATRTTAAAARHSPRGRRCGRGRWAPPEREAGAIRLQELAGELLAWGERASLLPKRAGYPHAGACGQSARWSARIRRSPTLARDPHADKQTIAFHGANSGRASLSSQRWSPDGDGRSMFKVAKIWWTMNCVELCCNWVIPVRKVLLWCGLKLVKMGVWC